MHAALRHSWVVVGCTCCTAPARTFLYHTLAGTIRTVTNSEFTGLSRWGTVGVWHTRNYSALMLGNNVMPTDSEANQRSTR